MINRHFSSGLIPFAPAISVLKYWRRFTIQIYKSILPEQSPPAHRAVSSLSLSLIYLSRSLKAVSHTIHIYRPQGANTWYHAERGLCLPRLSTVGLLTQFYTSMNHLNCLTDWYKPDSKAPIWSITNWRRSQSAGTYPLLSNTIARLHCTEVNHWRTMRSTSSDRSDNFQGRMTKLAQLCGAWSLLKTTA